MKPFKKLFTPAEAVKTLPLVRKIVADILNTGHEIRTLGKVLGDEAHEHPQIRDLVGELQNYVQELEDIGCFYKDWNFEIGLIDFPAIIDDQTVFLCWRSDEPQIRYYHHIEAGYAGRTLIPESAFK